jgi:hypothetical protein
MNRVFRRERQSKPMPNELRISSMTDWTRRQLLSSALFLIIPCVCLPVRAQQPSPGPQQAAQTEEEPEIAANEKTGAAVIIDGRTILTVYQPIGTSTPEERAERIAKRITAVAEDATIPPESVAVHAGDEWTEISAGPIVFMAVTDLDAKMAGKPRKQVASEAAGLFEPSSTQLWLRPSFWPWRGPSGGFALPANPVL